MSLKAHGTVGKRVTYKQKRGFDQATTIPTHPDAETLRQIRQRTIYLQGVMEWHMRTPAEQKAYETEARPLKITGFNLLMRRFLNGELDGYTLLLLPLDLPTPTLATDFSGYDNHGTIIGATPAAGIIGRALYFDGNDDYVNCGTDSSLRPLDEEALEALVYPQVTYPTATHSMVSGDGDWGQYLVIRDSGKVQFIVTRLADNVQNSVISAQLITAYKWTHLLGGWDGAQIVLYINGIPETPVAFAGQLAHPQPLKVGVRSTGNVLDYKGIIDLPVLYSKVPCADLIRHRVEQLFRFANLV